MKNKKYINVSQRPYWPFTLNKDYNYWYQLSSPKTEQLEHVYSWVIDTIMFSTWSLELKFLPSENIHNGSIHYWKFGRTKKKSLTLCFKDMYIKIMHGSGWLLFTIDWAIVISRACRPQPHGPRPQHPCHRQIKAIISHHRRCFPRFGDLSILDRSMLWIFRRQKLQYI